MAKIEPYVLRLQITRMLKEGQSFFAPIKVQDWLKERGYNPADYNIIFHQKPPGPVEIELQRKDGQEVDVWLQEQINLHS
jgi:hypothetical protein